MQFSAHQIASLINGTIEGNPDVSVERLAKIEEGRGGSLSFLSNPKYEPYLYTTEASVVIINESLQLTKPVSPTLIRVKDAYLAFSTLLDVYNRMRLEKTGIEEPSFIHDTVQMGENVYI